MRIMELAEFDLRPRLRRRGYGATPVAVEREHSMTDRNTRLQELFDHHGRAYGLAMRYLGNSADAEDAVQNAYLQVVRALDANTLPAGDGARAWLLTAVVGHCKDLRKQSHRRRRREAAAGERLEAEQDMENQRPAREAQSAELRSAIDQAMVGLNDKQRLAVALRYEQDLSYEEAASIMDTTVENLRVYVQRGLDAVRKTLQTTGYSVAPGVLVAELQMPGLQAVPSPQLAASLRHILDTGMRPAVPGGTAEAKASGVRRAPRVRHRLRPRVSGGGSGVALVSGLVVLIAAAVLAWHYWTQQHQPAPAQPAAIAPVTPPPPAAPVWTTVLQDDFAAPSRKTAAWQAYPGGLPAVYNGGLTVDCAYQPDDPYIHSWHLPGGVQSIGTWSGALRVQVDVTVSSQYANLSPVLVLATDDTEFTTDVDALYTQSGIQRIYLREEKFCLCIGGQEVVTAPAPRAGARNYPCREHWEMTMADGEIIFRVDGQELLRGPFAPAPNDRFRLALHAISKADAPDDAQIQFEHLVLEQRQ